MQHIYKLGPINIHSNIDLTELFCVTVLGELDSDVWKLNIEIIESLGDFKSVVCNNVANSKECLYNEKICYIIDYEQRIIKVFCLELYNFLDTFFNVPLQKICLYHGCFMLHAMGIVNTNNEVSLFFGHSGVGKSTLLNNLMTEYDFFCDDTAIVLCDKSDGSVKAWPTSAIMKVDPNQLSTNPDNVIINSKSKALRILKRENIKLPNNAPFIIKNLFSIKRSDDISISPITTMKDKLLNVYNNIYDIGRMSESAKSRLNASIIKVLARCDQYIFHIKEFDEKYNIKTVDRIVYILSDVIG